MLENILNSDDKFDFEQFDYIVNHTDNRDDYMLLNMIEKRLISIQGPQFLEQSQNKISYIMGMILKQEQDVLYKFYSGSFDSYMDACNNNFSQIPSFNLTYVVLIHIAIKILRKNSTKKSK